MYHLYVSTKHVVLCISLAHWSALPMCFGSQGDGGTETPAVALTSVCGMHVARPIQPLEQRQTFVWKRCTLPWTRCNLYLSWLPILVWDPCNPYACTNATVNYTHSVLFGVRCGVGLTSWAWHDSNWLKLHFESKTNRWRVHLTEHSSRVHVVVDHTNTNTRNMCWRITVGHGSAKAYTPKTHCFEWFARAIEFSLWPIRIWLLLWKGDRTAVHVCQLCFANIHVVWVTYAHPPIRMNVSMSANVLCFDCFIWWHAEFTFWLWNDST